MELVTSYILWYESSQNPYEMRKKAINEFLRTNSAKHIDINQAGDIKFKAEEIMKTGVKMKDAYHVACAIFASRDYFLTTDDRLLKYQTKEIQLLNPIDFIKRLEDNVYG